MPRKASLDAPIPDFSIRHSVGFAKSLSLQTVLIAVHELKLKDEDLKLLMPSLQALFSIKCVFAPAGSLREQIHKSLATKMAVAERSRPNIIQFFHAMESRAVDEGRQVSESIHQYIDELNAESLSEARRLSPMESNVLKSLPSQTEGCQRHIEYHWQAFRVQDSALTLSKLSSSAFLIGCKPMEQANKLFSEIYTMNSHTQEAMVTYWVGTFNHNLKNAAHLKRNFNMKQQIKFNAERYRSKVADDVVFKMCSLFTHFADDFRKVLTEENWYKLVARFKRGGLDSEMQEKAACERSELKVTEFRFLAVFGVEVAAPEVDVSLLDDRQMHAEAKREEAQIVEATVTVEREQKLWKKHLDAKALFLFFKYFYALHFPTS